MKKFAKVLACVLALTMVCSFAFAGSADDYLVVDDNNIITVFGTDEAGAATGYVNANGIALTDVYGVAYTVEFDQAELDDAEFWIGGGIGCNSDSTQWSSLAEWGKASGEKAISIEDNLNGTTATLTYLSDAAIFTADETYAQIWIQVWGGAMTVTGADLLGADGSVLVAADAPADDSTDAPADDSTDAPATDNTPATGDATSIVALAVVAVLAMGGVVVSSKKRA